MNVPEVVRLAKGYVVQLFEEENPLNVGLEEIEFDDKKQEWDVTIGFSRPWNVSRNALSALTGEASPAGRSYKIVRIRDSDGQMVGLKQRAFASG
ncbi:hypothetical protein [Brevundimonas subvibrioides]|uniref:hypothetical protein n=1 Tax=Brevundimonas subvibrioides TaxID=74313 RepID=UPI0022B30A9D|nr:hypothetical protein [Brevundimonas subvibrioides]